MTPAILKDAYNTLRRLCTQDQMSADVAKRLSDLARISAEFLATGCQRATLTSRVPDKEYFSFESATGKVSRPVNAHLYDVQTLDHLEALEVGTLGLLDEDVRARFLYTVVSSFFCWCDMLQTRDQKTPATYFEVFCGHLLSRAFGTNPRTEVEVLHLEDERATLPTDFIFDLGSGKPKFHVPVKISTRERAIQVFAHQRVLDGVYGVGRFTGLLICFTETKLGLEKREVVEICLPQQWKLYQRHLARLERFYYLDPPAKYMALNSDEPAMAVKSFGAFFDECDQLARR